MRLRFQADADFNQKIVAGLRLREPALEIQTADDAVLRGVPDREVLAYCARERRVLLTHDARTMPYHFGEFVAEHTSAGLITVSQAMAIRSAIEELLDIWSCTTAEERVNAIRRLRR